MLRIAWDRGELAQLSRNRIVFDHRWRGERLAAQNTRPARNRRGHHQRQRLSQARTDIPGQGPTCILARLR